MIVAAWDFSDGINTMVGKDKGPYLFDAHHRQLPDPGDDRLQLARPRVRLEARATEYGAIHFHDDDVDDARWDVDFEWTVPTDHPQRVLRRQAHHRRRATRTTCRSGSCRRSARNTAKIAVMVPTISYMAYANEHLANNAGGAELLVYRVPIMQDQNMFLAEHREYGGSIYDTHTDGSGICLSSRLRPILSIRPKYDHFLMQAPWQYPADLHLIYWLEKMGYEYDVHHRRGRHL